MFSVDEKCIRCGLCSNLCPARIIETGNNGVPFVPDGTGKKCIECGQCVSFCPKSACYLNFQPVDSRVAVDALIMPSSESAETFLRSRRSVRRFKEEELPQESISRILETARYAPTGANRQEVRWIVSRTREKTKAIAGEVIEYFREETKNADASGSENARYYTGIIGVWNSGYDIITRDAPNIALAVMPADDFLRVDGAIALTYLELAAYANGVGCCWAGFVTIAARSSREFCRFIGVHDDETVIGGQMMGFPIQSVAMSKLLPPRKKVDVNWI